MLMPRKDSKEIGGSLFEVLHSAKERAQYDELRRHHLNRSRNQHAFGPMTMQYQQSSPQTDQDFLILLIQIFVARHWRFEHDGQHRSSKQCVKKQDIGNRIPLFLETLS